MPHVYLMSTCGLCPRRSCTSRRSRCRWSRDYQRCRVSIPSPQICRWSPCEGVVMEKNRICCVGDDARTRQWCVLLVARKTASNREVFSPCRNSRLTHALLKRPCGDVRQRRRFADRTQIQNCNTVSG